nr:MAG TPA: hypothetical protein [Caudoviricetes sp.]
MASLKTEALSTLASVTTPADTDLLPVGTGGGAIMKKLTFANLVSSLKSKLGIDELITKATNPVVIVTGKGTQSVTVSAHSAVNTTNYIVSPAIPTGYKELFYFLKTNGNGSVVPTSNNSSWICNTSTSSASVTVDKYIVCVRK